MAYGRGGHDFIDFWVSRPAGASWRFFVTSHVFLLVPKKVSKQRESESHFYAKLKFTPRESYHFACVFDHRR